MLTVLVKAPPRNLYVVLMVALHVDKGGTASRSEDLVHLLPTTDGEKENSGSMMLVNNKLSPPVGVL